MKKLALLVFGLSCSFTLFAGQAYMDRFNAFTSWYQNLPLSPSMEFLEFVKGKTPLANKLRDKWLYELARTKDWTLFTHYYQPTNDINLACYNQIAQYHLGKQEAVIKNIAPLWLSGDSRPQACNSLFESLLKSNTFDENLITQRIALALDKRNMQLARYLLKQYKTPKLKEVQTLTKVYMHPASIVSLPAGQFNALFYLYGLKRLVSINMDNALKIWQLPVSKKILNEGQQQAFLAHIALYKAMRNHDDALAWFNQIKPNYFNELLIEWQIRFALKNKQWSQVISLIEKSTNKNTPCWQYWLARALEQQGKLGEAQAIYEPLAKNRHYYGFLASIRLKKKPSFDNERPMTSMEVLKPYQPVIDQVKGLYRTKQNLQASRLLNDFFSELPKDEASALVYWIDSQLHWHGKSVYLSNNELLTNQLSLRFPLAYHDTVKKYAQQYAIPSELIYAVIRQESGFREDVVSSAGARGLMQLMPRTASVISKASKIPYANQNELFSSHNNIRLGIAYLQQLTKRFNSHPILVAAAYNAGPSQVVHWLKAHASTDIDIWIETLPWQETRNYLKNVTAFYVVYQYRLHQRANLKDVFIPLKKNDET